MKRFLAISLMMISIIVKASACAGGYTHNYYMMNIYPKYQWENQLSDRYNKFWRTYTNDEVWGFSTWQKDNIIDIARKKGDNEIIEYVDLLSDYLDNCGEISNGWDYPTAEQLNKQDETMERILAAAKSYKGSRLRAQYALMQMRANMQLERHQDNINYWTATASSLPESVYRDMMKNIYAGALLRTGQRKAAWNIYAEQGDYVSLRWSVFKYRNLAGIQKIYGEDANAEVLSYLVQDFVNSAQETYDNLSGMSDELGLTEAETREWVNENVNMVGCNPVYDAEVNNFINFAHQVVSEKKNNDPALWMAAAALLHYFQRNNATAMNEIEQAMKLGGSQRIKDNVRAIRLLIATSAMKMDKKFSKLVVSELQWLDEKIAGEGEYDEYFTHAKDRIVNIGLTGRYLSEGNKNMAAAVAGMDVDSYKLQPDNEGDEGYGWNPNYSGEFYAGVFSEMTADEVIAFYSFLNAQHKDELEKYVCEKNLQKRSADYFNDFIGTKLLAEGKFADAVPYLEKVPLRFMEQQNISWYLANRDYTKPRWFGKQNPTDEDEYTDGPGKGTITVNKKLQFCRDMQQLMARHLLAPAGDERKQLAYEMAVRYYQASPWGDCWFLSDYGWSSYRSTEDPIPMFVTNAYNYLTEAMTATNPKLRLESLYARAYLPTADEFYYNWENGRWIIDSESSQHQALNDLADYVRKNTDARGTSYIMQCDIIQQFIH